MNIYIEIIAAIVIVILIWYTVYSVNQKEYMRGYMAGSTHSHFGLKLKALRKRSGQSLSAVSEGTGLETELIAGMEEGVCEYLTYYEHLADYEYEKVAHALFEYFGADPDKISLFVRIDKSVIKINPCEAQQSVSECNFSNCTAHNPNMRDVVVRVGGETKDIKKTQKETAEEGDRI